MLMKESTLKADMIVELRFFLIFIARERPLFHVFATSKFERTVGTNSRQDDLSAIQYSSG